MLVLVIYAFVIRFVSFGMGMGVIMLGAVMFMLVRMNVNFPGAPYFMHIFALIFPVPSHSGHFSAMDELLCNFCRILCQISVIMILQISCQKG